MPSAANAPISSPFTDTRRREHAREPALVQHDVVERAPATARLLRASTCAPRAPCAAGTGSRPGRTARSALSSSSPAHAVRKPSRPRLTPRIGIWRPARNRAARSSVPSPPNVSSASSAVGSSRASPSGADVEQLGSRAASSPSSAPRRSSVRSMSARPSYPRLPTTPRRITRRPPRFRAARARARRCRPRRGRTPRAVARAAPAR